MITAPSLSPEQVSRIVTDIFSSMVGMELRTDGARRVGGKAGARVAAVVGIGGPHRYAVVLETSEKFACRIAEGLSGDEAPAWSSAVEDAFAEIANMTAGNFKTTLGEKGLFITLPTVIHGVEYFWSAPRLHILLDQRFYCEDEELRVCVGDEPEGAARREEPS